MPDGTPLSRRSRMAAAVDSALFTAGPQQKSPAGPSSNTGQKSTLTAPMIDFCTVVFDFKKVPSHALPSLTELVRWFFSCDGIAVGPLMDRPFNFYPESACMIDATGSVAGRIGTDGEKMCISLTGQGCQHVKSWSLARQRLESVDAKLTRCDIAVDDTTGAAFNLETFVKLAEEGAFITNGRPPETKFVDDMGSGKGCSLYIGQKGHKQLNVYEKGKQLGDPDSSHVRCELRLYAKRLDLPLEALTDPGKFFAGAYPLLAEFVIGEAERLQVKEQMVNASAKAMVRFMRNQAGTALQLVMDALGDEAVEFLLEHIARPGRPGRFKQITGDLSALVRAQLTTVQEERDLLHEDRNRQ